MKKLFALVLGMTMCMSMISCRSNSGVAENGGATGNGQEKTGSVYYLNFKPEQDGDWKKLAESYTKQTGVPVTILTAASGQYETTLKSQLAKSEAPTLFQVNGPVGLAAWKNYCYDLRETAVVQELASEDFALKNGDEIAGVGYVIETYGLIYNKDLLQQAGYDEKDIQSFQDLKKVAEDITARSDELGFAAFTSAGMDSSSDWRFTTHLANLPIYYEYQAENVSQTDRIKGTYLDQYRKIWDLYINNSTCNPALLSTKTGDDAVAEFITEQAVFYQNGTWAYHDIADLGDDRLGMLPIYIGAEDEENQGLCTGTENYWCVNKNASQEDIQATLDFLEWCVTSEEGLNALCRDMGFVTPFKGNLESENPLANIASDYVQNGNTSIGWVFSTIPSDQWKKDLGSALTAYAANQNDESWGRVEKAFVEGWAAEADAVKR